jgi:hypothetical protein
VLGAGETVGSSMNRMLIVATTVVNLRGRRGDPAVEAVV